MFKVSKPLANRMSWPAGRTLRLIAACIMDSDKIIDKDCDAIVEKCRLILGNIPFAQAEGILSQVNNAESPLAHAIRQKLVRHAGEVQILIDEVQQTVDQSQYFINQLPTPVADALENTICNCDSLLSAMLRRSVGRNDNARILSDRTQGEPSCTSTSGELSNSLYFESNSALEVRKSEVVVHGRKMLSLLEQNDAEAVLNAIKSAQTPLADTVRQKLTQHATELESLIKATDQLVNDSCNLIEMLPESTSEEFLTLIRDGKDSLLAIIRGVMTDVGGEVLGGAPCKSGTSPVGNAGNSSVLALNNSQHWSANRDIGMMIVDDSLVSMNASSTFCSPPKETISDDDSILSKGMTILRTLPLELREAILAGISRAATPLANVLREKLVQHASELDSLLSVVEEAVIESQTLLKALPCDLAERLISAIRNGRNPMAAAIRGRVASGSPVCVRDDYESSTQQVLLVSESQPASKDECEYPEDSVQGPNCQSSEETPRQEIRAADFIVQGRLLINLLPSDDAEAILTKICTNNSLLAHAIRRTLAQHSSDLLLLIETADEVTKSNEPSQAALTIFEAESVLEPSSVIGSQSPGNSASMMSAMHSECPRKPLESIEIEMQQQPVEDCLPAFSSEIDCESARDPIFAIVQEEQEARSTIMTDQDTPVTVEECLNNADTIVEFRIDGTVLNLLEQDRLAHQSTSKVCQLRNEITSEVIGDANHDITATRFDRSHSNDSVVAEDPPQHSLTDDVSTAAGSVLLTSQLEATVSQQRTFLSEEILDAQQTNMPASQPEFSGKDFQNDCLPNPDPVLFSITVFDLDEETVKQQICADITTTDNMHSLSPEVTATCLASQEKADELIVCSDEAFDEICFEYDNGNPVIETLIEDGDQTFSDEENYSAVSEQWSSAPVLVTRKSQPAVEATQGSRQDELRTESCDPSRAAEDGASGQPLDVLNPEQHCRKVDVALASQSWTPAKNLLNSSRVDETECGSSHAMPATSDGDGHHNSKQLPDSARSQDLRPVGHTAESQILLAPDLRARVVAHSSDLSTSMGDLTVSNKPCASDAFLDFRKYLSAACIRQGIPQANQRLSLALKGADIDGNGCLTIFQFATVLSSMGLPVRKYLMRRLKENDEIFQDGLLNVDAFLKAMNSVEWWPREDDFARNAVFLSKLSRDLEKKFGPQIADVLVAGKNVTHMQTLLLQADRDERALEEMKSFVEETIQVQSIQQYANFSSLGDRKDRLYSEDDQRHEGEASPYSRAPSNFIASCCHRKPSTRSEASDCRRGKNLDLHRLSDGGQKWRSSGQLCDNSQKKVARPSTRQGVATFHPHTYGYGYAESRTKAREYAFQLTSTSSSSKTVIDNSERFWRRLPFPIHAIEYRRWNLLKDPVPGFSDPKQVSSTVPCEQWKFPTGASRKLGSRFRDPFGSGYEVLEKSSIQMTDFKEQRSNVKLVLEGEDHMRGVRKLVVRGNFDRALQSAACALHRFKSSGKFGLSGAKELGDPVSYVATCVKSEISKMIKVANEHLIRRNYEKALSHIPFLRNGARWLITLRNTMSTAGGGNQTTTMREIPDVTDELNRIESLTTDVIAAQRSNALAIEASSISSYFSNVKAEFELYTEPSSSEISLAAKRRNQFPDMVITDGTAYVLLLDVKPADLPSKLLLGTKLKIQGPSVMGSGRKDDGSKPRFGSITAYNESSSKYKIQYTDDYEWMSWPSANHNLLVEIDIDPEEVLIDIPGFEVRSKSFNVSKSSRDGPSVVMVAFVVTPFGPPFNFSIFGSVKASVLGVKSGKSLLGMQSAPVQVFPPKFLIPASEYLVVDSHQNEPVAGGILEFTQHSSGFKNQFSVKEKIKILQPGVYTLCCRSQRPFESPSLTFAYSTCVVMHQDTIEEGRVSRIVLNQPVLRVDELRVVLTWNEKPFELDAHVYTSCGEHISYETGSGDDCREVSMDMDSLTGFGPETVTIRVKRNLSYSFSVRFASSPATSLEWVQSGATAALYDVTGLFAMFHIPPAKYSSASCPWWHVFAIEGNRWEKPGHGLVRVNKIMSIEMPQLSLPGWPVIEAARHGLWDEFCDLLTSNINRKGRRDQPSIFASDLANLMSLEGETVLGLICRHSEDEEEDPSRGNEDGITPLQKQLKALTKFMELCKKQSICRESLVNGGLPSVESFQKECRIRTPHDCFIFRAVSYASSDVALHILNSVAAVVKRSLPGQGYRQFFDDHGDSLLLACIERRNWRSVTVVLQALLSIEAVWQRRASRRFQSGDLVQVEDPNSSGQWRDAVVVRKMNNNFQIKVVSTPSSRDVCLQRDLVEEGETALDEISPTKLRWRSKVVEKLREICVSYQEQVEAIYLQSQKEHSQLTESQKQIIQIEGIYHEILLSVTEKASLPNFAV